MFGKDVAVTGKHFFNHLLKACSLKQRGDKNPQLTAFRHELWKCNHSAGKPRPERAGLYVRIANLTKDSNSEPAPLSPKEVCRGVQFVVDCTVQLLQSARDGAQAREVAVGGRFAVSAESPLLRTMICDLLSQVIANFPVLKPAQVDGRIQGLLPALELEPDNAAAGGPAPKRPKTAAAAGGRRRSTPPWST